MYYNLIFASICGLGTILCFTGEELKAQGSQESCSYYCDTPGLAVLVYVNSDCFEKG